MSNFVPFNRDQAFLLPPDLRAWLPEDDLVHFVVAAVDRVPVGAFAVPARTRGKPQYQPRLMLALLIYSHANGIFSSRRIARATWGDIAVRFVAANLHPDHDTMAVFRRSSKAAFEVAFLQVLLLAREAGLLRLGTVSIDGTRIDANASRIRSVRCDRAKDLRARLAADIAALTARAEAADAEDRDPQALPAELARREVLKAKLDAACARLEAEAQAEAEAARPAYEAKQAAHAARKGRRGRAPKPPDDEPPPERQSNLTDPDSALMRRPASPRPFWGWRQPSACPGRSWPIPASPAARQWRGDLQARGIEPLVAIGRTQQHRPYDFRPPPKPETPRQITEPWRVAMKAKLESENAKSLHKKRRQTVEPVFGIIKSAMRFVRFHLRGLHNVAAEWSLIALACNCRRIARLKAA